MHIKHKETGKTVFIELQNDLAGYRERVYLSAEIAESSDRFGNRAMVAGHYNPRLDTWFTTAGNFRVRLEANASCTQLKNHGFIFTDAKEKEVEMEINVDHNRYPHNINGLPVTELMVCQSAAGYFIGRMCWDEELHFEDQYSRESDYYPTKAAAQKELEEGFEVRVCGENELAYNQGLPRPMKERK